VRLLMTRGSALFANSCIEYSPRPTPEISEAVDKSSDAHDCIQVRLQSIHSNSNTVSLQPMGWTSEMVAKTYKVSRQKQDEYALISHTRAAKVNVPYRHLLQPCSTTA
jgi:acetyl-CoA acetyltransferase